jgi:predicted LPLAT superfamily acyltransferase
VRAYVRLLERQVLRHPLQWFNLFSFWAADHAPVSDAIAA